MRRLFLIPIALLGLATAGALASIKQANASSTGWITGRSATSITVGSTRHHLTCAITAYSPDTTQFASGDRVKIACASHVLVAIADAPTRHKNTSNEGAATAGLSGAITALTSSSITVHDGNRTLTCALGSGSPSPSGFNVGDHAAVGCANGLLVTIGRPGSSPPAPTTIGTTTNANVTNANGPITALNATSISVQTMTCSISPTSALATDFHLGDPVRMYCVNGVLYQLKHNDTAPPAGTTTTTTTTTTQPNYSAITGTITALDGSTITVTGGDSPPATLTCTLGTSTPSTSGFATGNPVRMYCLNGALYQLKHNDTTPPPTTTTAPTTTTSTTTTTTTTTQPNYSAITGTITALDGSTITVTGGDSPPATLTCTLGTSTPSTSGFATGNPVRMYCLNGALYQLKHNDTIPPPTTTTATTTTTTTTTTEPNYTYASGTILALSSSSITVGSGAASMTCSITSGSPNTSGFVLGNSVGMYCATSGATLYALAHR